jgi:3-phenylpropionate/trans-cinnamate dioxygenase ferredoxin subunit
MPKPPDDNFIRLCATSELETAVPRTVELDDRFVVVVRLDEDIYCIDDVCTHDGGTLGDGELEGHCLVCPRHGAKFDVRTGEALTMPATEPTGSYEVKIVGDSVYARVVDER